MIWEQVQIGDICNVISGYAFKSKDFTKEKKIPVVKIKNIKNGFTEVGDEYFVSSQFLTKIDSKYHLQKGDILISLTGSHITVPNSAVGRIAKYQYDFVSLLNQRAGKIIIKNEDEVNQAFLYYFLSTYEVRFKLAQFGRGGANQCNISPSNVKSVLIDLPPLPTQKKIASILSAYDDLIENNLKRIKLLEEAAQRIYKEWFIDFKFPGHENTPINAETGLPEGWRYSNFANVAKFSQGLQVPTDKQFKNHREGLKQFIRIVDVTQGEQEPRYVECLNSKYEVSKNDLFMIRYGSPKVVMGYSGVIANNFFRIQILNDVKMNNNFLYSFLNRDEITKTLMSYSSSATMPAISFKRISNMHILYPDFNIQEEFSKIQDKYWSFILTIKEQNQSLKEARDLLLPRLMNRTLEV